MTRKRQRAGRSRPSRTARASSGLTAAEGARGADRELTLTREDLLYRERLRVLGQLAASIAHDLGNTLRGASFQLTTILERGLSESERAQAITAVARRVEIASEAIARLHDFARTGELRMGAVKLDRIVAQAAALVDTDFRTSASPVRIRIDFHELPPVRGTAAELSLLFVNLLCNARDAMPEGGDVTIRGELTRKGVVVTISDAGTGFSPEIERRLFEPFFTTKGSKGVGLGLWLASGTMERLGGRMRAINRPDEGALIELVFPPATDIPSARSGPRKRAPARRARKER